MSLSNYGETQVLNMFVENMDQSTDFYYLALFTDEPGEEGETTNEVSTSSTGYARQAVTFGTPASGSVAHSEAIEVPTATGDWGTGTHWALCDAVTGGNVWWTGEITTPKAISTGDVYRIPVGYLTLTMD